MTNEKIITQQKINNFKKPIQLKIMKQQNELIAAFKAYADAHKKLNEQWTDSDEEGGLFLHLYPFTEDFDSLYLKVKQWTDRCIYDTARTMPTVLEQIDTLINEGDRHLKQWLQWIQAAGILTKAKDTDFFHSGGGMEHLFIQMEDGRIIALHLGSENIELSFSKWDSINDYIEASYSDTPSGFGYEQEEPHADRRTFEDITPETIQKVFSHYLSPIS